MLSNQWDRIVSNLLTLKIQENSERAIFLPFEDKKKNEELAQLLAQVDSLGT